MAVNFWGVVHMTRAFLPHLTDRREAALVNVSSMGAFVPVPGQSVYGASKAAVMLLTEGLYAELRGTLGRRDRRVPGRRRHPHRGELRCLDPGHGREGGGVRRQSSPSPADAARQIIEGMEKGRFRVVIGRDARALDLLSRLSPRRATDLVAKKMASLLG